MVISDTCWSLIAEHLQYSHISCMIARGKVYMAIHRYMFFSDGVEMEILEKNICARVGNPHFLLMKSSV